MSDNLQVGGTTYYDVDYITVRDENNENVKYFREGQGGGGGSSNLNYRVATKEEILKIFKKKAVK